MSTTPHKSFSLTSLLAWVGLALFGGMSLVLGSRKPQGIGTKESVEDSSSSSFRQRSKTLNSPVIVYLSLLTLLGIIQLGPASRSIIDVFSPSETQDLDPASGSADPKTRGVDPNGLDVEYYQLRNSASPEHLLNAWELRVEGSIEDMESALVLLNHVIELEKSSPLLTRSRLLHLKVKLLLDLERPQEAAKALEEANAISIVQLGGLSDVDARNRSADEQAEDVVPVANTTTTVSGGTNVSPRSVCRSNGEISAPCEPLEAHRALDAKQPPRDGGEVDVDAQSTGLGQVPSEPPLEGRSRGGRCIRPGSCIIEPYADTGVIHSDVDAGCDVYTAEPIPACGSWSCRKGEASAGNPGCDDPCHTYVTQSLTSEHPETVPAGADTCGGVTVTNINITARNSANPALTAQEFVIGAGSMPVGLDQTLDTEVRRASTSTTTAHAIDPAATAATMAVPVDGVAAVPAVVVVPVATVTVGATDKTHVDRVVGDDGDNITVAPLDTSTTSASWSIPRRSKRALVFGIDNYIDWDFGPLDYAVSDAEKVGASLADGGFTVDTTLNGAATRARILGQLHAAADASQPGDEVVIFFAGHGFSDSEGRQALVTADGVALELETIQSALAGYQGKATVIFDNCLDARELFSKRFELAGPVTDLSDGTNDLTVYLASPRGVAFESHDLQGGLFTHALLRSWAKVMTDGEAGDRGALGYALRQGVDDTPGLAEELYGVVQMPEIIHSK